MSVQMLLRPGHIELQEFPVPEPGPGEVVVRVRRSLTCGTDLKTMARGHPAFPMPTPFGHEFSGEIAAVGAGVRGWREGDAVMATPTAPCGSCFFCDRGQENLCESLLPRMVRGAFGQYLRLPRPVVETNLFPKPASLSFAAAALLEPLSCVTHGLGQMTFRPDETAVIIGAGAIALLHVAALRARGIDKIFVVGRSRQRAQHAVDAGADEVWTDPPSEVRERILARTNGRGADVVIECTGQVEIWETAPSLARRGGTVVLFGGCVPGTRATFETHRLHYDQVHLLSPFHFTPKDVRSAHDLLVRDLIPHHVLVSGTYPLDHLEEALEAHRAGRGIKYAIDPWGEA